MGCGDLIEIKRNDKPSYSHSAAMLGSEDKSPAMEMSLSIRGHWMPNGDSRKSCFSRRDAVCKRGNHASGAPTVLPSSKETHITSSSNRTTVAEMIIPGSFNLI